MSVFNARHLSCERNEHLLFNNLNVSLAEGEILYISGPNGCGKTSLLKILAGILPATRGKVYWHEKEISQQHQGYRQQMIYIGHQPAVKANLTVYENLKLSCALSGWMADPTALKTAIARVGLPDSDLLASQLSAGQKRRLALARLFIVSKKLWILDEPLTALDKAFIAVIQDLFAIHTQKGGMIIMTSHQLLELKNITQVLQLTLPVVPTAIGKKRKYYP